MKITTHNLIQKILSAMDDDGIETPEEVSDSEYDGRLTISLIWKRDVEEKVAQ